MWRIDAEVEDFSTDGGNVVGYTYDEDTSIRISGPAEDGMRQYRHECKQPEDPEYPDENTCGHEWTDEDEDPGECPYCGGEDLDYIETVEDDSPLSWLNSAGVRVRDGEVHLHASVGDPRGAFVFTLRKTSDGTLLLHTPYPGESLPHMGLKPLQDGTFQVGPYNSDQQPPLRMADDLAESLSDLLGSVRMPDGVDPEEYAGKISRARTALQAYKNARGS